MIYRIESRKHGGGHALAIWSHFICLWRYLPMCLVNWWVTCCEMRCHVCGRNGIRIHSWRIKRLVHLLIGNLRFTRRLMLVALLLARHWRDGSIILDLWLASCEIGKVELWAWRLLLSLVYEQLWWENVRLILLSKILNKWTSLMECKWLWRLGLIVCALEMSHLPLLIAHFLIYRRVLLDLYLIGRVESLKLVWLVACVLDTYRRLSIVHYLTVIVRWGKAALVAHRSFEADVFCVSEVRSGFLLDVDALLLLVAVDTAGGAQFVQLSSSW